MQLPMEERKVGDAGRTDGQMHGQRQLYRRLAARSSWRRLLARRRSMRCCGLPAQSRGSKG